ncbi:hypothetical protein, partial [Bacteroides nordii]|uniref:hypothetical protein n=1 Tax=Bacteroides nordii TaxID=291645 RepID=UPI0024936544
MNEIFKEKSRILSVFIKNIQFVQCSYPYQYAFIYVSNSFNMRITQRQGRRIKMRCPVKVLTGI